MAKKCIPGVICLETATILTTVLLFLSVFLVIYFFLNYNVTMTKNAGYYQNNMPISPIPQSSNNEKIVIVNNNPSRTDSFNDIYSPPLKTNSYFFPPVTSDIRSTPMIPINIETQSRGFTNSYNQIGIITRNDENKEKMILPLMGRLLYNGRDKWQYYTTSNTGVVNTKLPIRFKGRSCSSDTGCDEIFNNDSVFVEGYKENFSATIYENGNFSYIPMI
jgi:hypothetical protein